MRSDHDSTESIVHVPVDGLTLEGALGLPAGATGIVLFAHGSGSSRLSPRNNYVASILRAAGLGTLLIDLLTRSEDVNYDTRFDIPLLTGRLIAAIGWLKSRPETKGFPIGCFGASTGAAAALRAAADSGHDVAAVVSRGGRPDLAGEDALGRVRCPTLLLVGGHDPVVLDLNREAHRALECEKELVIVPGATHLFEEPGTLEQVARLAAAWFKRHLQASRRRSPPGP